MTGGYGRVRPYRTRQAVRAAPYAAAAHLAHRAGQAMQRYAVRRAWNYMKGAQRPGAALTKRGPGGRTLATGNFRGKFRKGFRVRVRKAQMRGSVMSKKYGGVATAGTARQSVQVGHAVGTLECLFSVCRGLIRLASLRAGEDITAWGVSPPATVAYRMYYRLGPDLAQVGPLTVAAGTGTYEGMADELAYQILNVTTSTSEFYATTIEYYDSTRNIYSVVSLSGASVMYHVKSILRIQNRTESNATAAEEELTTDVRANPLVWRSFKCAGNAMVNREPATGATLAPAGAQTGVVKSTTGDTGLPSPAVFVNCRQSATGRLAPGAIKSSVWVVKKVVNLQRFWAMINPYLRNNNKASPAANSERVFLGPMHIYEFEKMIDSHDDEPVTKVGFELITEYSSFILSKSTHYTSKILSDGGAV